MNFNSFKKKFHPSWHKAIKPFIESEECDEIFKFLKEESKGKLTFPEGLIGNKQIAPASYHTFRAFKLTPLNTLKCVIIGDAPYSKFKNDKPTATGLLLDCYITEQVTPELRNFYEGIEKEYYDGLKLDYIQEWDLSYLAKRGVLLLNSSLTVKKDENGGHETLWRPFITYLLEKIISHTNVPILLIGKKAQKYKLTLAKSNYIYLLDDIGSTGKKWNTRNIFTTMNDIIDKNNEDTIMWLNIDVPF